MGVVPMGITGHCLGGGDTTKVGNAVRGFVLSFVKLCESHLIEGEWNI